MAAQSGLSCLKGNGGSNVGNLGPKIAVRSTGSQSGLSCHKGNGGSNVGAAIRAMAGPSFESLYMNSCPKGGGGCSPARMSRQSGLTRHKGNGGPIDALITFTLQCPYGSSVAPPIAPMSRQSGTRHNGRAA